MSRNARNRIPGHMRPAKIQISMRIRAAWSEYSLGAFRIAKDAKCFLLYIIDWSDCMGEKGDLSPHQIVRFLI